MTGHFLTKSQLTTHAQGIYFNCHKTPQEAEEMTRLVTTGCPIIHMHDVTRVEYDADPTVFKATDPGDHKTGFTTRHFRIYDKSGYCILDLNLFAQGEDSGMNTLPEQWIEPEKEESDA
jgi:hypothetical protein